MSALEITPATSRKPRFPKDQTLLRIPETAPAGCQIHMLDSENSLILIGSAINDPDYLRGYIERALAVPRSSPLCGTPAGPKEIPRAQLCYTVTGEPYTYSKTQHPTTIFPPHVTDLIQILVQRLDTAVPDQPYRVVDTAADLLYSNQHKNGGSISAHSDDENPNWGLVLVYSLGQTRYLRVRAHDKKSPFVNVELAHNTIAAMLGPTFQARYTHQIDKLKEGEPIHPRLSLNVRFLAGP